MLNKTKIWHTRFMQLAYLASTWSKDPSTRVGAVIVNKKKQILALSYNGFPTAINDDVTWLGDRGTKNSMTVHAEVNAILSAKRKLNTSTMYVTHYPCHHCAKIIAQTGIKKVFYGTRDGLNKDWDDSFNKTDMIFKNAGIYTKCVDIDKNMV